MPVYSATIDGKAGGETGRVVKLLTSGAIPIMPGQITTYAIIKGGAAFVGTLAAPAAADNGKVIMIWSETAVAHTITVAAGWNGGGGGVDLGTFGAASGNGLIAIAHEGNWYIVSNINVVLS